MPILRARSAYGTSAAYRSGSEGAEERAGLRQVERSWRVWRTSRCARSDVRGSSGGSEGGEEGPHRDTRNPDSLVQREERRGSGGNGRGAGTCQVTQQWEYAGAQNEEMERTAARAGLECPGENADAGDGAVAPELGSGEDEEETARVTGDGEGIMGSLEEQAYLP
jgi:hypothetical protein